MTKCLIECLITYFYYLTDDYVVRLICHLSGVYRELLEPSLINRVLIPNCSFNNWAPKNWSYWQCQLGQYVASNSG